MPLMRRKLCISIHAPTRGATAVAVAPYKLKCISIHAPTRGATEKFMRMGVKLLFQSTLLQEERQ